MCRQAERKAEGSARHQKTHLLLSRHIADCEKPKVYPSDWLALLESSLQTSIALHRGISRHCLLQREIPRLQSQRKGEPPRMHGPMRAEFESEFVLTRVTYEV